MGGFVGLLLLLLGGIVGEKIQLLCLVLAGDIGLGKQFIGADAQPANQQILAHDSVIEICYCLQQVIGRGGVGEVFCTDRVLGNLSTVSVNSDRAVVVMTTVRVIQVFPIIAHGEHQLIGY